MTKLKNQALVAHPFCGCILHPQMVIEGSVCSACLSKIDTAFLGRAKHPVCGCLKPAWSHRPTGPCSSCLKDIEREYLKPAVYQKTIEDIRGFRRVLLEETDWVEINPARVRRTDPEKIAAIHAYRQALFDITNGVTDFDAVVWPTKPEGI